jgi:murein DD-endopeptidase MepM/ murein hydrolase activator NlpD
MYKKVLISYFVVIIILVIFLNIVSIYATNSNIVSSSTNPEFHFSESDSLSWPVPGFHNITSNFGTRVHPITKKVSSHSGIDISATPGTDIYSASSGVVTLASFNGANGYSIHIENGNFEFIYGHVSPNYIVSVGDIITQNQIIGNVGPKYVDKTPDNKYTDSSRSIYKWLNYWSTLAF